MKKDQSNKSVVQVYLPESTVNQLRELATERMVSTSNLAKIIITKWIDSLEKEK